MHTNRIGENDMYYLITSISIISTSRSHNKLPSNAIIITNGGGVLVCVCALINGLAFIKITTAIILYANSVVRVCECLLHMQPEAQRGMACKPRPDNVRMSHIVHAVGATLYIQWSRVMGTIKISPVLGGVPDTDRVSECVCGCMFGGRMPLIQ